VVGIIVRESSVHEEEPFNAGAGVALTDVLALAGLRPEAAHVGFEDADLSRETKPSRRFGGSIPVEKACRPEALLAWAMNGAPLPLVHGAPLRVVVPGYIGAGSVKWLDRIEVRSRPWPGYFQYFVYRLLPEDGTPGPGAGMPLGLIALNSDVLSPADGDRRLAQAESGPQSVETTHTRSRVGSELPTS
jgi:sulfite oxidase